MAQETRAYSASEKGLIGAFTESSKKNRFEYRASQDAWGKSNGLPHEVAVGDFKHPWRAANVKSSVCYIAVDEDEFGKPVLEKWTIRNHVKYGVETNSANPALEVRNEVFNPMWYESGVFEVKDENDQQTDENGEPLETGWYYWLRLGRTKESDKQISEPFPSKGAAKSALNKQIDAERGRWEAQGRSANPALEVRMRGTDIVGYTYDADYHSIKETKKAWKQGYLKEVKENGRLDEHGIPEDLEDSKGNMVHPVFASDEGWEESDFDDRSANAALETRGFESDDAANRELHLYIMNSQETYNQYMAFVKNYAKKIMKGSFDETLAIKGLANNLVANAARLYRKEHGFFPTLTQASKEAIAKDVLEEMMLDIQRENMRSANPALETRGKDWALICAWLPVNQVWAWFYGNPKQPSGWDRVHEMGFQTTREEALAEAKSRGIGQHKKLGKAIMYFDGSDLQEQHMKELQENSANPAHEIRSAAQRSLFGKLNQQVWYRGAGK